MVASSCCSHMTGNCSCDTTGCSCFPVVRPLPGDRKASIQFCACGKGGCRCFQGGIPLDAPFPFAREFSPHIVLQISVELLASCTQLISNFLLENALYLQISSVRIDPINATCEIEVPQPFVSAHSSEENGLSIFYNHYPNRQTHPL
jgi:hypothetical protein